MLRETQSKDLILNGFNELDRLPPNIRVFPSQPRGNYVVVVDYLCLKEKWVVLTRSSPEGACTKPQKQHPFIQETLFTNESQ